MKKFLTLLLPLFFLTAMPASAKDNPFFNDHDRQVAFHFGGYGVDTGIIVPPPFRPVPFVVLHAQYSLPTDFFELPARKSINIAQTIGFAKKYGWDWPEYSIPMVFVSEDVALLHGDNWYTGLGAGMGFQAKQNERIGSKFIFQFKLFAGMHVSETTAIEIFALHMSNGNTAPENNSYAWYGIGFTYNF